MQPKQIASRYDVVREVGRGGMGSVWLCSDQVLGRDVAVKQMSGIPGETTPQVARALREARSSAALNHPNVVSIFDVVEEDDRIWLVMEYLPGRTLAQIIKEDGALPATEVAAIGAQVADGLAAAHERGTVHRDVKPSNILVTDDGRAKISDFGIARTLGEEQLTQTGLMSGTPLYFSPELARGADPAPSADVWALGASLYAAIEGTPPWPQQENPIAMLVHIANNEPPRPSRTGPLSDVIAQMLVIDPDERLSMREVRDRLRTVAADPVPEETRLLSEPVPARVPAPAPTPGVAPPPVATSPTWTDDRPDRGRRRATIALVACGVVLLATVGVAVALGADDDSARERAEATASTAPTDAATTGNPDSEPSSSPEPTSLPSDESSEEEPVEEETETDETGEVDAAGFVADYYGLLPGNTKAAWDMLGESMQGEVGNYGSYQGFWRTIEAVDVDDVSVVEPGVVDVTITYVTDSGSESETRRLTVEASEEGERIVDDYVV